MKPTIDAVSNVVNPKMVDAEAALTLEMGKVSNGGDITTAQLLKIQSSMAKYTLTATIFSAITKELSDSLKQTASKIG